MSDGTDNQTRRSSRAVAKPNFRALDGGAMEEDDEDWSSEDIEAEVGGQKRRKGGKGGSRSHYGSSKSRQRKTAAVGDLEVAAQEAEAAVAELQEKGEAWKEKYTLLVEENEALKRRVAELMQQANQVAMPSTLHTTAAPLASAPLLPSVAVRNTATPLEMPVPGVAGGISAPVASFGSPLPIDNQLADAPAGPPLQQQLLPQQELR